MPAPCSGADIIEITLECVLNALGFKNSRAYR